MLSIYVTIASIIFVVPAYSLRCFVPGDCINNIPYKIHVTESPEDCIYHCQKSIKCIWSTFNPNRDDCSLFMEICYEIGNCPLCLTSEKNCTVSCLTSHFSNV